MFNGLFTNLDRDIRILAAIAVVVIALAAIGAGFLIGQAF